MLLFTLLNELTNIIREKCKVVVFLSNIASVEFHYTLFGRARWKTAAQEKEQTIEEGEGEENEGESHPLFSLLIIKLTSRIFV